LVAQGVPQKLIAELNLALRKGVPIEVCTALLKKGESSVVEEEERRRGVYIYLTSTNTRNASLHIEAITILSQTPHESQPHVTVISSLWSPNMTSSRRALYDYPQLLTRSLVYPGSSNKQHKHRISIRYFCRQKLNLASQTFPCGRRPKSSERLSIFRCCLGFGRTSRLLPFSFPIRC
jgi:hypothetical protein